MVRTWCLSQLLPPSVTPALRLPGPQLAGGAGPGGGARLLLLSVPTPGRNVSRGAAWTSCTSSSKQVCWWGGAGRVEAVRVKRREVGGVAQPR